jgi:archaellum component FlaF (FlaF/FlaG flagellin family)
MKKAWLTLFLLLFVIEGVTTTINTHPSNARSSLDTIPLFKFPWNRNENPWYYLGGPHTQGDQTPCNEHPVPSLTGIDLGRGANRNVLAMADGTIIQAGWRSGGWGYTVEIDHSSNCSLCGYQIMYAHLAEDPRINPGIKVGEITLQGTIIGIVGATGLVDSGGAHLHLELKTGGAPVTWDGVSVDGWKIRAIRKESDLNIGFNYEGTATLGSEGYQSQYLEACGKGAAVLVGLNGTKYADENWGRGNDLYSTNDGGVTIRVSVNSNGVEGNIPTGGFVSGGAISDDGRYVAFASDASNLVPADTNGQRDVFVRDLQTGTTTRVSIASDGSQGNNISMSPTLSADGRYVAFTSWASNLVPGDTNETFDIFVHDRQTRTTSRVNISSSGLQDNIGTSSDAPAISANGQYVAFSSLGWSLVSGDTNQTYDVFVRDLVNRTTTRVSVSSNGVQGNGHSFSPAISADGRYITFDSGASNLISGDTNLSYDTFVHDRQTGSTTRVSVASNGSQGNGRSLFPAISADGQYVTFDSDANNLVPGDTNGATDIFIHDLQNRTTARVSVASDGSQGNNDSWAVSALSADGRYVAFGSLADNLVPGDTNGKTDVFVHDRLTGKTTRVSISSDDIEGNGPSGIGSISRDGRYVVFSSDASNLVPGDTNEDVDVFVRDRQTGELLTQASGTVAEYGCSVRQENIGTINLGETSTTASFDIATPKRSIFTANWLGSVLRLSVFRPDGSLYDRVESSHPPLSIVVPLAEKGQWSYQITGVDVPYNNYPYVVLVGTPNSCALPRDLNVDGKVNVTDVQMAATRWGQTAPLYDLDGDNRITNSDIARTVASWRRTCDNFILNYSFEDGQNNPTFWTTDYWQGGSTFTWDNTQAYRGSKSVRITSPVANDARWIQTVPVTPNTDYYLSGLIKTENVVHAEGSVVAGANLGLYGTWEHTPGLLGTNDWDFVIMGFNSGSSTEVTVACRLGYWSGTATGKMWCDNIILAPKLSYGLY